MWANLERDVDLKELAGIAGLSPSQFCRAFKESTGMTPHAALTQCRIERAQALALNNPDTKLTELALSVGYGSQASFGAAFKRLVGRSPGQWRRSRDADASKPD
ncbi:MAG: AraC family transcriptional regulator [Gammaproteobacteria bacterium]|nr:AraC family transcriptional regulator [Gammaproteobacteria bacterium]